MMDLNFKKKEIKNFSIDVVKNYEGCADALIYLKRLYGDNVDDLRYRKQDLLNLAAAGKNSWLLNFLLNLIAKHERIRYGHSQFITLLDECDTDITDLCVTLIGHAKHKALSPNAEIPPEYGPQLVNKLTAHLEENKKVIGAISSQHIQVSYERVTTLHLELHLIQASLLFSEEGNKGKKASFTRNLIKAFDQLAQANFYQKALKKEKDLHTYSTAKYLQVISIDLINQIGIWKEKPKDHNAHPTPTKEQMTRK